MASLATALGKMSSLIDMAAYNHALADAVSHPGKRAAPVMPSRGVVTYHASCPPSATGGTGEQPSWWHWVIDAMPGLEWPDADTGGLNAAAAAWDQAARGLESWRDSCVTADMLLSASRSPEIPAGKAAIAKLSAAITTLATQARALGTQCREYAASVESARSHAETTFKGVLVGLGATVVAGAVITFVSGGAATPVVAGGASAEVGAAAAAVAADLAVAAAEAGTAAGAVATAGTAAVDVAAVAAPYEAATAEVAAVSAVSEAGSTSGLATRLAWTAFNGATITHDYAHGIGTLVEDPVSAVQQYRSTATWGKVAGDAAMAGMMFLPGGIGRGAKALREAELIGEGEKIAAAGSSAGRRALTEEEKRLYKRPSHWRKDVRKKTWEAAKKESPNGVIRDPGEGRKVIEETDRWQMGHKPGREFWKHQRDAADRGLGRKDFLDEFFTPEDFRPELPETNWSHSLEEPLGEWRGHGRKHQP